MRPLVKGPAWGGGTELLKKGRLLLLLSKALQCWNASKWEVHWTMLSNKLQHVFPFALINLGIVTNKSPDWTLKQAFLENVQFGIRFLLSREMSFNIFLWNIVVIVNQDCFKIILFFCIWCFVLCWGLTFCWLMALGWQNIKLWLYLLNPWYLSKKYWKTYFKILLSHCNQNLRLLSFGISGSLLRLLVLLL